MASITEHSYTMFPRPAGEASDFMLYPEQPTVQPGYHSPPMDMTVSPEAFGFPRNTHEVYHNAGFEAGSVFNDAQQFGGFNGRSSPGMYPEDGDSRVPSNISTASAPSASSSTVGSPHSNHGQLAFIPEYSQVGLGVNPSIVGQTEYYTGTEYSFSGPGMEDFNMTFDNKPNFVGESAKIPRTQVSQISYLRPTSPISSHAMASELGLDTSLKPGSSPVSPLMSRIGGSGVFSSPSSSSSFPSPALTSGFQWNSPASVNEISPVTPTAKSSNFSFFSQSSGHFVPPLGSSYPSLIHPEIRGPMGPPMPNPSYESNAFSPQNHYPTSPPLSGAASPAPIMRHSSQSPYVPGYQYSPFQVPHQGQRPNFQSPDGSQDYSYHSGDESKEKQRCPHPECGKTFKDLKAHMLTHQQERPEKCPIQTCEYHIKGFARKYDKNRHTLTHYKGTMVCGFCPGSGSAAEKSFNRADVFKRHLTAVHGVEQTPPNSRKKTLTSANSGKKLTGYAPDATGKCSTCSATFSNAQDFYEHLDDCVLRIVQQEDPAEIINAQRLSEVEYDKNVHQTLEKNQLPLTTETSSVSEDEEDDDMADDDEMDEDSKKKFASPSKKKSTPTTGVQKSRGMTHSRGGVALQGKSKSRKNRRDYPSSWGFDKGQMTMKKRVMAVFDGPRRLAKDDMMLSTEQEVRVKIGDGNSYVTDLDVQTMKRAQGFLDATEEEKGTWISDDPTEDDLHRMLKMAHQ